MMASLLLVPAAVAYAEEPVAGETFASVDAKQKNIDIFTNLDIGSTASVIGNANTIYTNLVAETESPLFSEVELNIIKAKLDYIAAFKGTSGILQMPTILHGQISNISTAKATYLTDVKKALDYYGEIGTSITSAQAAFELAMDESILDIVGELEYTDLEAEEVVALNAFIAGVLTEVGKTSNLTTLTENEVKYNQVITFIEEYILEINEEVDSSIDEDGLKAFKTKVDNAKSEMESNLAIKAILEKSTVPDLTLTSAAIIKAAEDDISAAAKVDGKIEALIKAEGLSATQFNSKLTEIRNDISKLSKRGEKLVIKMKDYTPFAQAKEVIDQIAALKPAPDEKFREAVKKVHDVYKALGDSVVLMSVINSDVLLKYVKDLEEIVSPLELQIAGIATITSTTEQAEAIAKARGDYNKLSTEQKKMFLSTSLKLLTDWEGTAKSAGTVDKLISAIFVEKSDFSTKTATAQVGYEKLNPNKLTEKTDQQKLVVGADRLLELVQYASIAAKVNNLKVSLTTYAEDLVAVTTEFSKWSDTYSTKLSENDIKQLKVLHTNLDKTLKGLNGEFKDANDITTRIETLKTSEGAVDLVNLAAIRLDYTALSSNGKKLVTNIKILTDLEKQYKTALAVVAQISKLKFSDKNYAKQLLAADTAYGKLGSDTLKAAVTNYKVGIEYNKSAAQLMIDIDALKPTMKDFKTSVEKARADYNKTVIGDITIADGKDPGNILQRIVKEYLPKLLSAEKVISDAKTVVDAINALQNLKGQAFMDALAATSAKYKALDSSTKKNVTNASTLTAFEKDYNASLKVFNLIKDLPATTDKSYPKKVEAAEKAYGKLTNEQKGYVHNYETALKPNLKVAKLISQIDALKISSKTYEVDVKNIRATYDALTEQERALVHNYSNLQSAEGNMSTAQGVISLIEAATPNAEDYIAKLLAARNAYDSLSKDQQKLVLNIKELTTREKSVKPILSLDQSILALDPSNAKTFISKYAAADKAYEKLSFGDRGLLTQEGKLKTVLQPLYNVMNQIASIKSSSKTFVSDVQAARAAYTALTPEQQAQISNVPVLETHERDVLGGAAVDALIRALSSNEPSVYVQKVKEASLAYKGLNSTNKKGVTLLDTLKAEEKYIKPVEAVITLIEGLNNPRNNLSKQFDKTNKAVQKLTSEQIRLVTNYGQYSDLSSVVQVYQFIEKLKPSDKYYLGNLEAAKSAYGRLTEADKLRVTNQYKLQEAEGAVDEIQKVITIIASLSSNSPTYLTDIEAALAAYKALPSGSKKQVNNYSQLQAAEKNVKAAQKVIKQISDLDPSLRTFESKTKSAKKAYEKLTPDQQKVVSNYSILRQYQFELGL